MEIISILKEEDIELFSDLLTKDVEGMIGQPGYYTIGAYDGVEDFAAGVLQFYIGIGGNLKTEGRITSVTVDPVYQAALVTGMLIDNMMMVLEDSRIRSACASMADRKEDELLRENLQELGFTRRDDFLQYTVPLGDLIKAADTTAEETGVRYHGISELAPATLASLLSDIARHIPGGIAVDMSRDIDDWDPIASCYYKAADGSGVLLFRRKPSGDLEAALLRGYGQESDERLCGLAMYALSLMKKHEKKSTVLSFACRTPLSKKLAKTYINGVKPVKMREFALAIGTKNE